MEGEKTQGGEDSLLRDFSVLPYVINNFDVSKAQASVLEGFKDLPIAFVSFLVASWLPTLGYRKAMQKMRLAAKYNLPVICFIDTPGAYPGIGAEERGQAQVIRSP